MINGINKNVTKVVAVLLAIIVETLKKKLSRKKSVITTMNIMVINNGNVYLEEIILSTTLVLHTASICIFNKKMSLPHHSVVAVI